MIINEYMSHSNLWSTSGIINQHFSPGITLLSDLMSYTILIEIFISNKLKQYKIFLSLGHNKRIYESWKCMGNLGDNNPIFESCHKTPENQNA